MSGKQSILKLHREFLPPLDGGVNDDSVFFSISAMAFRMVLGEKEKINLHWDCHFNIRSDNTRITLHSPSPDAGLAQTETKLVLLRDTLVFFCAEVRKRMKEPGGGKLSKRIWLNEDSVGHYTGYCFYEIEPDGCSKLFIADCHRTLNYHLDVFRKVRGLRTSNRWTDVDNKFTKGQLRRFDAIVKNLNLCLDKIAQTREEVLAGKLGVDVERDKWNTGTDPGAVSA